MSAIEQQRGPRLNSQAYILPITVGIALIGILLRLWFLQIVKGEELGQQGLEGRTVSISVPAPRGEIVDRRGLALAGVKSALALMVTPGPIMDKPELVGRLAQICSLDKAEMMDDIKENSYRRFLPFVAKLGITAEQAVAVEEQRAFLPGVFVRPESVRQYPFGPASAHVIGYVGVPNKEDVRRLSEGNHGLPSFVGKVGVERVYDDALMGIAGKDWVEVDSRGRQLRAHNSDPPIPGSKVVLTIDLQLQKVATELMAGRKGAVVALDPRSGEILCMVSGPSFDPNLFARRAPRKQVQAILRSELQPMHDRASRSAYAPGSTFKIATLIGGIQTGTLTPTTTYHCTGGVRLGSRLFRCLGHHGTISYERAMEKSCNVFFAQVGRRAQGEGMAKAAIGLGLGHKTGVDLLGENPGIIPNEKWIKEHERTWYPGDAINMAVGQGYVEATALQMATYIATVASRGKRYRPHLLRSTIPPGIEEKPIRSKPELLCEVELSDDWWDRIHRALTRVVQSGTARSAQISGITVAGKTGSSEHRRGKSSHGWFVAFAPVEHPQIAIAVVLEAGGHGGSVAAPVARGVIEKYLRSRPQEAAR
ncbi:MAG: penicillin-binding protein 2 [Armatimonadetes bacterium]|nr:penicillin-binding protein 2 [Armatimonadota bacterium]